MIKHLALIALVTTLITFCCGCTAAQQERGKSVVGHLLDKAMDIAEARANAELDGLKK